MNKKTILFLDVDGVFSIPNLQNTDERRERLPVGNGHHLICWPIPLYRQLLYAIGIEKQLHPVWLSAWGDAAHALTNRAFTQAFPVAYPLSPRKLHYARQHWQDMECIDRKLVAAHYYLIRKRWERVIWIEDGFAEETMKWARSNARIHLVDTTQHEVHSLLLSEQQAAIDEFIDRYILREAK